MNVTLACEDGAHCQAHKFSQSFLHPTKNFPVATLPLSMMMKQKLQHTTKAKAGLKRKIELVEVKPNKTHADIKSKPPLKSELIIQLKMLQDKYNALHSDHKQNIELIKCLNDKVERLEHKESSKIWESKILPSSVSIQTEEIILCHKCDFEAEDKYELDAHTWELHDTEASEDIVTCWYCGDDFETKSDLMKHRKREHVDRVNICKKYAKGVCPFDEGSCWYYHTKTGKDSGTKSTDFTCRICDKTYSHITDFMRHRRCAHYHMVPQCFNMYQGTCVFGEEKCWFKHEKNEDAHNNENKKDIDENETVTQKMLDMMEKFTKRLIEIEDKL